jgi:acetylornithine/N-succinyldiaminopimelate aminotransferase
MPTNAELIAKAKGALYPNYQPPPFVLTEGKGCWVKDVEGNTYLDFSGGIAVVSVGHAHPRLAAAIAKQAARLMHTSNLFYNDKAIELAAAIVDRTPFDRVYFANSGTEANEALIKLARRWNYEHGRKERVELVAANDSFHGRTMGSITLTGQPKYHAGMGPLLPGVHHVPYNDLEAMKKVVSDRTAAVFLEPVQGEGGIAVGDPEYLRSVRALCDERGALLFFDEVQTCYGRTGTFLGREHSGVMPDGCSIAKGMAGGFPIGAMLVTEKLADGLPPGSHATTFGGNPLGCAAGLEVLAIFDDEKLVENARDMGERLGAGLAKIVQSSPAAVEARGLGLLRGLRIKEGIDPRAVLTRLREEHMMLGTLAGATVLRVAPPLNVTADEIDDALARLGQCFAEVST